MKYLVVLLSLIVFGCSKNNDVVTPEVPEYTINIDYAFKSAVQNVSIKPYYPDSIRFSFTTSDTGQYINYNLIKELPIRGSANKFQQNGTNFNITLILAPAVTAQDYFYGVHYTIFRAFDNHLNQWSNDESASIYLTRNK